MKATDINQFRANHMNKRANLQDLQDQYKQSKVRRLTHLAGGNYTKFTLLQVASYLRRDIKTIHRVDLAGSSLDTAIVYFTNGLQTTFYTYDLQYYYEQEIKRISQANEEYNYDDGYTAYGDNRFRY